MSKGIRDNRGWLRKSRDWVWYNLPIPNYLKRLMPFMPREVSDPYLRRRLSGLTDRSGSTKDIRIVNEKGESLLHAAAASRSDRKRVIDHLFGIGFKYDTPSILF